MADVTKKDPELGICIEVNCKAKHTRLSFCAGHYDEFKFGSIRKDGTHPVDKERKDSQYKTHLAKARK